ncbi:MAG: nucleotidyltransferase family protein [Anaerolineales bacterium]
MHPQISRVGYFGSYARGDWGVGSDLDMIIIVEEAERSFSERALDYDTSQFPVPLDKLVYTVDEWRDLAQRSPQFYKIIKREVVWVYGSNG